MPSLTKENSAQILDIYLKEHGIKKSYLAKKMNMSPSKFNWIFKWNITLYS